MTQVLHLPAVAGAPVACDMTTAQDTAEERLSEYAALFKRALARRERSDHEVVLAFDALTGVRETVDDLARREAACCPFLDYRVETAGDEVVWTITDPGSDTHVVPVLDEFYALADR